MLTVTIEIKGRTLSDIDDALATARNQIRAGFISGSDSKSTGRYSYSVGGDEGKYEVSGAEDETIYLTGRELSFMVELHNKHHDADHIELDEAMGNDEAAAAARQAAFDFAMATDPDLLERV